MRIIATIALMLFSSALFAQDANTTLPDWGQQIAAGAARSFADLEEKLEASEAEVAVLRQENSQLLAKIKRMESAQPTEPDYLPTFTWPGCDGTHPFAALAEHFRKGEAIHKPRDVTGWSPLKLAFTHDQEHYQEYAKEGKPFPEARDPRLKKWAQTLPKAVERKIVMETWRSGCSWCDKWLREDKPKAERDGFTVEVVYVTTGSVPRFRICDGDRCSQYQGYIQFERLKAMVR